jgi:hypothetical protein
MPDFRRKKENKLTSKGLENQFKNNKKQSNFVLFPHTRHIYGRRMIPPERFLSLVFWIH